jgi:hydroxypyruvate reductase
LRAVEARVRAAGYDCILLGDHIEGEAREVAAQHARLAREQQVAGRRAVIVSGGELTVTIRGQGRGGPNQEYALALATHLGPGMAAVAADTDGTDGGGGDKEDPAGAYVDASTAVRARALGLDPASFLAENDSTGFFSRLGDLLKPGPTFTNVNDFRAIIVEP